MSLGARQTIADAEGGPNVVGDSFIGELLAWGLGMVIDSELEWEQAEQTRYIAGTREDGTGKYAAGAVA